MAGPNLIRDKKCPFCLSSLTQEGAIDIGHGWGGATVNCPVCGTYRIFGIAVDLLERMEIPDERRVAMAFTLRRMTDRPEPPVLSREITRSLVDTASLPVPSELLNEALLWFGRHSKCVGHPFQVSYNDYRTVLGAVNPHAFNFLTDWMLNSGLFGGLKLRALSTEPVPITSCVLSPAGWERYEELSRSQALSRFGFMAMRYGDAELDALLASHFAPEVQKAGFDLRRLDQGQPAGLIDDQLRVMIRTSRFLVCDLTHGNRGAYWESGFAEGLGKPVIYTCRKDVFDDQKHEHYPHFDTNHMVTVIWDSSDPATAARRLKDTVRATLPSEAQLND